jgi:hypothetical protein
MVVLSGLILLIVMYKKFIVKNKRD